MSHLKLVVLLLPLLCVSATAQRIWQEGEIVSRKTVAVGHRNSRTGYVYRIKAGGRQYVARLDQPLSLGVYAPVEISVQRKHLLVRDADGSEQKAFLVRPPGAMSHR
jgi:hypothetical protein